MLRTALMLSAAAMLMLTSPTMAQPQLDENSAAQTQVQAQTESQATIDEHELTPPEASADASVGLEGDDELGPADVAPPIPSDEDLKEGLKTAMPDDADADDPDQLAQANQPDTDQTQQTIDEAGMPSNGAEIEGEQTELKGRDLEPMPEPEPNQQ
jgi:hypothetical protein